MQHDCMQFIPCTMKKWNPIECGGVYAAWLKAVDSCRILECSGFYAAWPKASRLNAVDSMQCDWMQFSPCSEDQCILIERSAYHAVWLNGSRLNAVDSMQCGAMDSHWMHRGAVYHNWMQWIPWSMIECSGFYAECCSISQLNEVDSMQLGLIDTDWMQ